MEVAVKIVLEIVSCYAFNLYKTSEQDARTTISNIHKRHFSQMI